MAKYVETTQEAGKEFFLKYRGKGPIVMLNMLKYRDQADYSAHPELKPEQAITGKQAYQEYYQCTQPLLEKVGSRVLFFGDCEGFLIGPESEKWDAVMLVEHASAEIFVGFAQDEAFQKTAGHRTAALEDSRLLPINQLSLEDLKP